MGNDLVGCGIEDREGLCRATRGLAQTANRAITLGCTLPNRLLTGSLTLRIGSHTIHACWFQMISISFQIAFRSRVSIVVTSVSTS